MDFYLPSAPRLRFWQINAAGHNTGAALRPCYPGMFMPRPALIVTNVALDESKHYRPDGIPGQVRPQLVLTVLRTPV